MAANIALDVEGIRRVLNDAKAASELRRRADGAVQEVQTTGQRTGAGPHIVDAVKVGTTRSSSLGAVVDIDWNDWRWTFYEFGTVDQPPHRALSRAVQNQGLKLVDRRGT